MPEGSEELDLKRNEKLVYLFTYLLTWVSGLAVFLTVAQTDRRLKFHSLQATMLGLGVFVLIIIPLPLVPLIGFLGWLYGMYVAFRAYEDEDVSMPIIGDYAKEYSA
jgi:uncharacterized membrane protein